MQKRLQAWLDPRRVQRGKSLVGMVPPADIERLDGLGRVLEPGIHAALHFATADSGRLRIQGRLSGEIEVTCQRCLEPMVWNLRRDVDIEVVANDTQAAQVTSESEPCLLQDGRIELREWVADELLLALPMAPMHDQGCAKLAFQS